MSSVIRPNYSDIPSVFRNVPFVAGDFSASATTWTIDANNSTYVMFDFGSMTMLMLRLINTTIGADDPQLRMVLPLGLSARSFIEQPFMAQYNGIAGEIVKASITTPNSRITFTRPAGQNFVSVATQINLTGFIMFESTSQ